MKRTGMVTIIAAMLLASCSTQPNGVGSYITSDSNSAMMVQITSIEDGRVSGTVSMVTSDGNGNTNAVARPFTGTLENRALNLSLETGRGLSLVTGMLDGENLQLTFFGNGNSRQIAFAKKDASEFDKLVGNTRVRSAEKQREIESAAAQKYRIEQRSKTQKSIDGLTDRLASKAEEIREKIQKLNVVIARYRSARDRIGKMQTAKSGISANSEDGAYRAGALDHDIDAVENDMGSMHRSVQSYAQNLDRFMAETSSESAPLLMECGADNLLDCSRLSQALRLIAARNQEFQTGLSREKAAFARQRGTTS